jgi:peptide/nickel transport system substrate-binding protein
VILTVGVGQLDTTKKDIGLQQVTKILALEDLVTVGRDGRPARSVADSWSIAPDGRSLRVRLRPNLTFHDSTPVTAEIVSRVVQENLPAALGPAFEDVAGVRVISDREIEIEQKKPSPFVLESLDFVIQKPGAPGVGTGPFSITQGSNGVEMRANDAYYLGRPVIDRIVLRRYPTVRAAWADMLRGQVDMLYEVGLDALESLEASSRVSVYTFPRSYAYVMVLNVRRPVFGSAEVRRALNQAIDRAQLIREALYNHGTPAAGPVWPNHWAHVKTFPAFKHDPLSASRVLNRRPRFTCIFGEGALFERLALAVQKQLATVGVDMQLQAVSIDELVTRVRESHDFDAVLFDAQLGPNLFRPYQWWHSGGISNLGGFSSPKVDAALDTIRYAANDAEYAAAVLKFQQAVIDDPPAVFLAWGERARAVSHRFEVPAEPGRDVLRTLRLFKLAPDQPASRN